MALSYTIDDIEITEYTVDITRQMVNVMYTEKAAGVGVRRGVAYFYVTMPPDPTPEDFQLPPAKIAELVSLRDDAEAAIATRLGV